MWERPILGTWVTVSVESAYEYASAGRWTNSWTMRPAMASMQTRPCLVRKNNSHKIVSKQPKAQRQQGTNLCSQGALAVRT